MDLEQKKAELLKRWQELKGEKEVKKEEKPPSERAVPKPFTSAFGMVPQAAKDLKFIELSERLQLFDSIFKNANFTDIDKNKLKANYKERFDDLKEPLTWFKKVVVGESRAFPGIWTVLPPVGITIQYMGEQSKQLAMRHAEMIQNYYE
jgi:hypothetical protein